VLLYIGLVYGVILGIHACLLQGYMKNMYLLNLAHMSHTIYLRIWGLINIYILNNSTISNIIYTNTKNPQKGIQWYFSENVDEATIKIVAETGKDGTGQQHCNPLLPAYKGLGVELWRRSHKYISVNVNAAQTIHNLMSYYTGLNMPIKKLGDIVYRDYNKWQKAKQSIQKVFPMNDENILRESEAPAVIVAQEATEVLASVHLAATAITNAENLGSIKKRKHTKLLSEVGAKYQRKLVGGIITELTAEYKDTIDNILLTILSVINRPHAIKITL
jgi:hypothetical protein